jgi:hypothetical protein
MKEIDVLAHVDGSLHPMEVKKSANPGPDALRQFNLIEGLGARRGSGAVLCLVPTWLPAAGQDFIVGVGMI